MPCIIIFDVKSMYPAIIKGENISPEMKIVEEVMGERVVKFRKDKEGLIPKVITLSLNARENYRLMRLGAKTDDEIKKYRGQEKSAKVGANATYGVLLYKGFRIFDKDCADATTRGGRRIIQRLVAKCLKRNIKNKRLRKIIVRVLYGDTDSIFILLDCDWSDFEVNDKNELIVESNMPINLVSNYLNDQLAELCDELEYTLPVEGKVEAILERIIFKYRPAKKEERKHATRIGNKFFVGAKKRYGAYRRWVEGKGVVNDHYIKGFGRSDVSIYTQRVYEDIWKAILDKGSIKEAIKILRDAWVDLEKASWYEISVPRGVKGNFDEYEQDSLSAGHIAATLYMIEELGIKYNPMVKPRTVAVRPKMLGGAPRKLLVPKRIALINGMTEPPKLVQKEMEIDFITQADTILKKPFELLVYSMGRQWSEVTKGIRQTSLVDSFKEIREDKQAKDDLESRLDDEFQEFMSKMSGESAGKSL